MIQHDGAKDEQTLARTREQLMAETFHDLTQPLTTLHCCLELCLTKIRSSSQIRTDLQIALQQAQSIAALVAQLRELADPVANHCSSELFQEPAPPLAWPSRCCR